MSSKQSCCFRKKFKPPAAKAPLDIKTVFDIFSDSGIMKVEHLQRFLIEYQGEEKAKASVEVVQVIIDDFKDRTLCPGKGLSLQAFFRYIFSDFNPPLSQTPEVHPDMTAPLSHYFIYTGYNSSLTENQISSDRSGIPLIKALQRGVRGIELDMWPNSTKDNVEILHGRMSTTSVDLSKCLWYIKEYAFSTSPYPVVVTLEDHLTPHLRSTVANMITQIFGEMLVFPGSVCLKEISPDSLKNRIIISTKTPKRYKETMTFKEINNVSEEDRRSTAEDAWGRKVSDVKHDFGSHNKNDQDGADANQDKDLLDDGERKSQQHAESGYTHLITIHDENPKGGIEDALTIESNSITCVSISERELEKAMIKHGADIVRLTQKNFLRVYPQGKRVDSSDYNPLIGWMHGAQMVAFDMQEHGRAYWLMHGMFRTNGGCGYVKKPDLLLKGGPNVFDPSVRLQPKRTLKVRVYMGDGWYLDFRHSHYEMDLPPDFCTMVAIAGVPADAKMMKTTTSCNKWIPVWNEEFLFQLTVPELAMLQLEVHAYNMPENGEFGGQTCLPVLELKPGIRAVSLFNRECEKYKSVKLLMEFQFV